MLRKQVWPGSERSFVEGRGETGTGSCLKGSPAGRKDSCERARSAALESTILPRPESLVVVRSLSAVKSSTHSSSQRGFVSCWCHTLPPACRLARSIMIKKTCQSLLAIARKRSRLLVMITAHHGTANGVQWGHLRAPAVESHHSSGRLPPSCLEAVAARGTVEPSSSAPGKAEWVLLAGH